MLVVYMINAATSRFIHLALFAQQLDFGDFGQLDFIQKNTKIFDYLMKAQDRPGITDTDRELVINTRTILLNHWRECDQADTRELTRLGQIPSNTQDNRGNGPGNDPGGDGPAGDGSGGDDKTGGGSAGGGSAGNSGSGGHGSRSSSTRHQAAPRPTPSWTPGFRSS